MLRLYTGENAADVEGGGILVDLVEILVSNARKLVLHLRFLSMLNLKVVQ